MIDKLIINKGRKKVRNRQEKYYVNEIIFIILQNEF